MFKLLFQILKQTWWTYLIFGIFVVVGLSIGLAYRKQAQSETDRQYQTLIDSTGQPVSSKPDSVDPLPLFEPLARQPSPSPTVSAVTFITHTVEAGEVLATIAIKYGVTVEAIALANNIATTTPLDFGQILRIPENPNNRRLVPYQVRPSDTLLSIAVRYNSSVKDILTINPQLDETSLQPSMVITIPAVFSLEPTITLATDSPSITHVVKAGETPLAIANLYDISVQVLLAVNEIDNPRLLKIGTELTIPPSNGLTFGFPIVLHEIEAGETLIGIVSKYGSSIRDILDANPDFVPANLTIGQLVAVPLVFPSYQEIPENPTEYPQASPPPPPFFPQLAEATVAAINAERVEHGASPLQADQKLMDVALLHAQDMVVRNFFAHTTPDGVTLRQRLVNNGFPVNSIAGENIQMNTQPETATVQVAVQWWMNSPPHRRNILKPTFNRIGVGVVKTGYRYTIVTNFSE